MGNSQAGVWECDEQLLTKINKLVTKCYKEQQAWPDFLDKRPEPGKVDKRFGILNVRSHYWAGLLMAVVKVL
jgi:hypothetical protein